MTDQQYQEAVDWLFVQAPNYQINGQKAYKPGLGNITRLCDFFGNPQNKIKTVHIGGTNGKGSVSNMLASVLQEAGYKTGLYNSPHLINFGERIKINGKNCDRKFIYDFILTLKKLPHDIQPSFFEYTTVMAFEYFAQNNVDIAIIEVGLGGRLDSTNIIHPEACAITNIDLDHMNILGDTVEKIAVEKAGIIKENVPVVCGDSHPSVQQIVREKALQKNAPYIDSTLIKVHYKTDLEGDYQQKNIPVATELIHLLQRKGWAVSEENIRNGLLHVQENTGFIGRWYRFSQNPDIICDTAHNKAGLDEVFAQLERMPQHKHMILGFVQDKDIRDVIPNLPGNAEYYFVKPAIERGRDPHEYEDLLINSGKNFQLFSSVQNGYLAAKQNLKKEDIIFVGGSNFVVGEFLEKNLAVPQ